MCKIDQTVGLSCSWFWKILFNNWKKFNEKNEEIQEKINNFWIQIKNNLLWKLKSSWFEETTCKILRVWILGFYIFHWEQDHLWFPKPEEFEWNKFHIKNTYQSWIASEGKSNRWSINSSSGLEEFKNNTKTLF